MPRLISRAEGTFVPEPVGRGFVVKPAGTLLVHHTGASGWPRPGFTDAQNFAALHAGAVANGKPYEYNYVITAPLGWVWEWAGTAQAAHCANANSWSYGVQMNLAADAKLNQAMIDSFRWLRWWLTNTGQLSPTAVIKPHYYLRSTQCSAPDCADWPHGSWPSPTGEGSLGEVDRRLLVPWEEVDDLTPEDRAWLTAQFEAIDNKVAAIPIQTPWAGAGQTRTLSQVLTYTLSDTAQILYGSTNISVAPAKIWPVQVTEKLDGLATNLNALINAVGQVNIDAIKAAVIVTIREVLANTDVHADVDEEAIANAVADKLAARLVA